MLRGPTPVLGGSGLLRPRPGVRCSSSNFGDLGCVPWGLDAAKPWSVEFAPLPHSWQDAGTKETRCFHFGVLRDPLDMPWQGQSSEFSAAACQQRCLTVPNCAYFTFF